MPAAGAADQGERGEVCDECCAKRRREESAAVMRALPSNAARAVAVRHAAVSEASRRASGARSDRRERRREGYPPEGARPRSGLDRVARSRSDAPSLIVGSRETVSMFGTIDCITVCTVVVSIRVTVIGTGVGVIIGNVIGVHRRVPYIGGDRGETVKALALSLVKRRVREVVRRKSGGAAAEPGAAGDARSEGRPSGGGGVGVRPQKMGRAAEATRPVVAMRLRRRRAGPGCRRRRPCRPGCR